MKRFFVLLCLVALLPAWAEQVTSPYQTLNGLLNAIDNLHVKSRGSTAWIRACKSSQSAFRAMDELKRFSKAATPIARRGPSALNEVTLHVSRLLKYTDASSLQCRCMKSILDTTALDSTRAIADLRALAPRKPAKKAMCS